MILNHLRHHTRTSHQRVELLVRVMETPLSHAQYLRVLRQMAAYVLPLERELVTHPLPESFDLVARLRGPALERDFAWFGQSVPHDLPVLPALPTTAHAAGALYVLEGSTLGGQIIARHLHAQLGLTADAGAAFFSGYGPRTAIMWRSFCAALTDYEQQTGATTAILEGAERTFVGLERWLASRVEHAHD